MSYQNRSDNHYYPRQTIEARKLIHSDVTFHCNVQGNTPLHWAVIQFNDLATITTMLNEVTNIHVKNSYQDTPLHIAIQLGNTAAALLLIKRGALVGENLDSLLFMAIKKKDYTIFKVLIDYGMQYNLLTNFKHFLNVAISQKHPGMIEYIIPHCQLLKPSDKYIPRKLVTRFDPQNRECLDILLKWNFTINPNNHYNPYFIYSAVEKGYSLIVSQLLKLRINVDMMNSYTGFNLLTIAFLNKHYEIVEQLLQHNANVNETIPYKNKHAFNYLVSRVFSRKNLNAVTCLHIAVFHDDQKMAELLLKYGAKKMNDSTLFNVTCIAVHNNNEKIVRILLDHGVNVTDINAYKESLLHVCVNSDTRRRDARYNIAKLLLEKGAHIHIQTPNNSLVFEAIENRCHEVAQLLLNYNANVQYISPYGETLLHKAIQENYDVKFIKSLLKLYPPVNTKNCCGYTPLINACEVRLNDQFEIIEALLHYNADIHCTDISLMTPLHLACEYQKSKLVKVFLNNGANPNATNLYGRTTLHCSCTNGSTSTSKIIQLLLEHDANIEAVDEDGRTPLHVACCFGNNGAMESLLDHGANINHIDLEYSTFLHRAVKYASIKMTKVLIKYGANINFLDEKNRTPLQNAVQNMILGYNRNSNVAFSYKMDYDKIIKILVSQGIKLKTAGLKVNVSNSKIVCNHDDYIIIDNVKYSAIDLLQLNVASDFNDEIISNINSSHDEDSIDDIRQLKGKCEQEIESMKRESIGIDKITFYDLLMKNIYYLLRFFKLEKVQQTLKSEIYDKKFPLYVDIVRSRFRKTKIRYRRLKLMNSAREFFSVNINSLLLDECIDAIFDYFSIGELEMFIETMKQSNV